MNSWVASRLSVIESRTNGPALCAVFQTGEGGDDDRERVPDGLGEHRAERRREVRDEQVADHDRGPQPCAVEDERGDADADGRPERRDGAVQVRQRQPDARRGVVERRHRRDREEVPCAPRAFVGRRASIRSRAA